MSVAPYSFKVGATLTAHRIVKLSAGMTVSYADTSTAYPLGITGDDVQETNQAIPIKGPGCIAELYFNDTVAVGGLVMTNATGQGIPAVATTAGVYVIGVLVGNAVAATGTIGKVLVNPFQLQIP